MVVPLPPNPGTGLTAVGMDLSNAEGPARQYACEVASVVHVAYEIRFLFGQILLGSDELDSVLVVRMNQMAARQLSDSIVAMGKPTLTDIAKTMDVTAIPLTAITVAPRTMVMVVANIGSVALSGLETCVDFYYATPFAIRNAEKSRQLALDPVVRVDIPTALFLSIASTLAELTKNMLATIPGSAEEK